MSTLPSNLLDQLELQSIELPSWAFGNSGTRFKVFATPGTPRDPYEKISDAAQVHAYTALAPTVALHIPWDKVDSYDDLRKHAEDQGVALGTINSNTFQDDDYKFGALTHEDAAVRRKAIDHHFECIDIMHATGSRDLKIWLAEGSNYPGQADLRGRQDRLHDSLATIYERLGDEDRLVLEYKFFEPAFYHTDVPDWGTSYAQVAALDANPTADRFGPDAVRGMYEQYLGGPVDGASLTAAPGLAEPSDVVGFPPALVVNGDVDELRVSGELFAATLASAGVPVELAFEPGTEHGHLNRPDEPAASATVDRVAAWIARGFEPAASDARAASDLTTTT